jgi:NAD(P)H-dependent flavin oxidoreductase YrpB (nitropropane dioxygenase family)
LNELVDVIIDEKAALFVCAIGVPPKPLVEKLHKAGIPVMNVSLHKAEEMHKYFDKLYRW